MIVRKFLDGNTLPFLKFYWLTILSVINIMSVSQYYNSFSYLFCAECSLNSSPFIFNWLYILLYKNSDMWIILLMIHYQDFFIQDLEFFIRFFIFMTNKTKRWNCYLPLVTLILKYLLLSIGKFSLMFFVHIIFLIVHDAAS